MNCSGFNPGFIVKIFNPVLPVILNEFLWSLAITCYSIVYAHIGNSFDCRHEHCWYRGQPGKRCPLWDFRVQSPSFAVIKLGRAKKTKLTGCWTYSGADSTFSILVSGIVFATKGAVVNLYKITPDVALYTDRALVILAIWIFIRSQNMTLIVGMLRSGGDTRYSLFLDGVIIWILGVPMAVLGGFILHLPVYWVYLMVMSEGVDKFILGLRRYFSRKWINNLSENRRRTSPCTRDLRRPQKECMRRSRMHFFLWIFLLAYFRKSSA